jgi:hypothetical protein
MVPISYVLVDDRTMAMQSDRRSQKVVNLKRDPRCSCLVEDGDSYGTRRGVLVSGAAEVVDDKRAALWIIQMLLDSHRDREGAVPFEPERVAESRVAIYVRPSRIVSWDHTREGGGDEL